MQKPRQVWRLYLSAQALQRRSEVRSDELQVWLGHAVHLFTLCRPALSVLQECYTFVTRNYERRAQLWPSVRLELHNIAAHLAFMCSMKLDAPLHPEVYMDDSPPEGYALMSTTPSADEVQQEMRFRERWRFIEGASLAGPIHRASLYVDWSAGLSHLPHEQDDRDPVPGLNNPDEIFGETVVKGPSATMPPAASTAYGLWLRENDKKVPALHRRQPLRHRHQRRLVDVPSAIPAISKCWDDRDRWRTLLEGEWKFPEEHINVKEARVALLALRRASRLRSVLGHRMLTFSDNLVTCTVADKGRSRPGALNAICRHGAAYQMGMGIRWRVHYVETDRNHADLGSRRRQLQESAWTQHRVWRGHATAQVAGPRELCLSDLVQPPGLCTPPRPPPWAAAAVAPVMTAETPVVLDGKAGWVSSSSCRPTSSITTASPTSITTLPAQKPRKLSSSSPSASSPSATPSSTRRVLVAGSLPELRTASEMAGKEPVVLELFAGIARLQQACTEAGLRTGPAFEITLGPQFDLSRQKTQHAVLQLIRSQRVWYVHMGTPRTVWLISRTTPKDCARTRQKERLGVHLAIFWSIGNPRSLRLWSFPPLAALAGLPKVARVHWAMRSYGEAWKKPTTPLTDLQELAAL